MLDDVILLKMIELTIDFTKACALERYIANLVL